MPDPTVHTMTDELSRWAVPVLSLMVAFGAWRVSLRSAMTTELSTMLTQAQEGRRQAEASLAAMRDDYESMKGELQEAKETIFRLMSRLETQARDTSHRSTPHDTR